MNRVPNRPNAPRTPGYPPRRAPKRRTLRPAAVAILLILVIALIVGVVLIVSALVKKPEAAPQAPASQSTTAPQDPSQTTVAADPSGTNETPAAPAARTNRFESLSAIVSYVDSLGLDFKDLPSYSMEPYFEGVLLKETADAGDAYENETVYIGDSLVLHMRSRSTHPTELVYAKESITPEDAATKKLAALKNGTEATFAEAMTELQPGRIVITIGTNSMWMEPETYLYFFDAFITQLEEGCPNTEIILQSTPPLSAEYDIGKNYPTNEKINRFNLYLAGLAEYRGLWFLNSAKDLKGDNGALASQYDNGDGFHITASAYDVWIRDLRTHATNAQS